MFNRHSLFVCFGLLLVFGATAFALPSGGNFFVYGHKDIPLLTANLRLGELDQINAFPGDEAYDRREIDDAILVLRKHGCTGIILPDEVIEAFDRRRNLEPHGVRFFKFREIELKPIISKPTH